MNNEELISFIDEYIRNSSIHAFQNLRLNTILKNLVTSGVTDSFDNLNAFKAAILANREDGKDYYMRARMLDTSYIYEYFPDTGTINWTASQQIETI